jgi:hypothetical protein
MYVPADFLVSLWTICQAVELDASESDGKDDCECTKTVQKCLTLTKKGDLGKGNKYPRLCTLEDGTDRLSRNASKELPLLTA